MSASRNAPNGFARWIALALGLGVCCGACASPDPPAKSGASAPGEAAQQPPEGRTAEEPGGTSRALQRSEHYAIVPPTDDPRLVEEVALRLSAVRTRLVAEFPPRAPDDAMASSAPCTVRLCPDRIRYVESGGPAGSTCFYDARRREMVLIDDRDDVAGYVAIWSSLQHIAVHEYFDEALDLELGAVPPWLLYGTAAVYAGMSFSHDELQLDPADPKFEELGALLAGRPALPLERLLSFDRAQFYGANEYDSGARRNLVLAWSFALFLRTGSEQCAEWQEAWFGFIPRFLDAWQAGSTGRAALAEALRGTDLDALDRAWRSWIAERTRR